MNEITKSTVFILAGLIFSFLSYLTATNSWNDHPRISMVIVLILALAAAICSWVGAYKLFISLRKSDR